MGDTQRSSKDKVPGFVPGLFSSLNTVRGLARSPARKSKPSQDRLTYLARPRSACPLVSARGARQTSPRGKRVEDDWALRTVTLVRTTDEEELKQATDTVARLHRQLETQKKGEAAAVQDYKAREELYQGDLLKLQQDCASLQTTAQQTKNKCAATHRENERLQYQLEAAHTALADCKDALRGLAANLLEVLEQQLFTPTRPDPETLRDTVLQHLEASSSASQANLSTCIDRVAGWGQQRASDASTMQQIPFDQIGSTQSVGEEADTQELEAVKQNVLRRISGYGRGQSVALALYDFPGTVEGDLPFQRGDHLQVLQQDPQGWWLGEKEGQIGLFPFNYVRLL